MLKKRFSKTCGICRKGPAVLFGDSLHFAGGLVYKNRGRRELSEEVLGARMGEDRGRVARFLKMGCPQAFFKRQHIKIFFDEARIKAVAQGQKTVRRENILKS